jgi:hypothetical protein
MYFLYLTKEHVVAVRRHEGMLPEIKHVYKLKMGVRRLVLPEMLAMFKYLN